VLTAAAAAAACVAVSLGDRASAQDAKEDSKLPRPAAVAEETIKGVEAMRLLLIRQGISARNADSDPDSKSVWSNGYERTLMVAAAGISSEAFVVPGQGATFIFRIADCVAPPHGAEEAAAGGGKSSAWDEALAEA